MSTITITNIKATGDTVSRSAKSIAAAWVNFNGNNTITIRDSINVTSLTDNGTANHNVNFTNHMATVGYHVSNSTSGNSSDVWGFANPSYETSTIKMVLKYVAANAAGTYTADRSTMTTGIHGDLA
tara:strand:- start:604 stop:981 length:378 start_codon:yes stop_codon:yes gene_type:complete